MRTALLLLLVQALAASVPALGIASPKSPKESAWIRPMVEVYEVEEEVPDGKGGKRQIKTKRQAVTGIEFLDGKGKRQKSVQIPHRRWAPGSRSWQEAQTLLSGHGKFVLAFKTDLRPENADPYAWRGTSNTHIAYYDHTGATLFELQATFVPVAISEDGQTIVALDSGIEPALFGASKWFKLPDGVESWSALKEDPRLINDRLVLLSKTGEVTFTWIHQNLREGSGIGPHTVRVSPKGRWIAFSNPPVASLIDVSKKERITFTIRPGEGISSVDDVGSVLNWKYVGRDPSSKKRRWKKQVWRPGQSDYEETSEVKEE